jgi:predicted transcriptional regulator
MVQMTAKTTKTGVPKPTDAELVILRVLWARGASTVREVHDILLAYRSMVYTTTLKLLQIMTAKGLTTRQAIGRVHRYQPSLAENETQRRLVGDLPERAFGGSASKLVMQALATRRASPDEIKEIRRLLADTEREQERASLLVRIANRHRLRGNLRDTCLMTAETIASSHEPRQALGGARQPVRVRTGALTPFMAQMAGHASFVLWAGVLITGRMIPYSRLIPAWWIGLELEQATLCCCRSSSGSGALV